MTVTFEGEEKITYRVITKFHTFDLAFKNRKGLIGFPVRGMCQISGYSGVGKSTLAYTLSGIVGSELKENITLADLEEHFDPIFMGTVLENAGFAGTVYNATGDLDHEKLEDMLAKLKEDNYAIGIVDSLGAISPVSEAEGGLEDSNMGRRAMLVAKLARRSIKIGSKKNKPLVLFATNHVHQIIGGRGTLTSGGVVKDYLSATHLRISVKETFDDGSTLIGGKVDKNSFGYGKRVFYLFNLAGFGIHPGLTAMYDCIMLKIAKLDRTVKMSDKNYGFVKKIIENAEDKDLFELFHAALNNGIENTVSTEEDEEE